MSSRYRRLLAEVRAKLDAVGCPYRFDRVEIGAAIDGARRFYGTSFIVKTEDPMRDLVVQRAADTLFNPRTWAEPVEGA